MTEDTLSVVSQYRPDLARAPKSVFKDINDIYRLGESLYIATNSGLLIYDITLDRWKLLNRSDGLVDDIILDIYDCLEYKDVLNVNHPKGKEIFYE